MWFLLACRVELGPPTAHQPTEGDQEIWLYTSMYEEVLAEMRPVWAERFPGVRFEVYQAGSEKVAQRFEAELAAGGSRACLLATSDPAWYDDLAHRGELLAFVPPRALALDPRFVHPAGFWTTVRLSLMVLASKKKGGPTSFREFANPAFANRITSPDPLASGTAFTSWSTLEATYGEEWLDGVIQGGLIASGGNSSTLSRLESGERDFGMLIIENLLLKEQTPVSAVFPEDGAIPIAGPVAIPTGCGDPLLAQEVTNWFFTDEAQQLITKGGMHSPIPGAQPPDGAPALQSVSLFPEPEGQVHQFKERWAKRVSGR